MRSPSQFALLFAFPLVFAAVVPLAKAQSTQPAASPRGPTAGTDSIEELITGIRQRDSAERRAETLAAVRAMLKRDVSSQTAALGALQRSADIKFDRDGLEAEAAALLASPSADVRRAALGALPTLNPAASRIEDVAKLAKDPDPRVRAAVMHSVHFIRVATGVDTPVHEPAMSLLDDPDKDVVKETARALWSVPLSPEVERKVVEMSQLEGGHVLDFHGVPYTMHYYVLSTRPELSKVVAERLWEIARHPQLDQNWTGRAVWGLAHPSAPEAVEVVTKALVEELDHSLTPYDREWALRGLAGLQTDAAKAKLAEVAAAADEPDELRKLARELSERR